MKDHFSSSNSPMESPIGGYAAGLQVEHGHVFAHLESFASNQGVLAAAM